MADPVGGAQRVMDCLRISVTERCQLRCRYCVPLNGLPAAAAAQVLSRAQIIRLTRIFAGLGVRRIRLTGGEPLLRPGVTGLARELAGLAGIQTVGLTTNGLRLAEEAAGLRSAGVDGVNVSLDTLREERFYQLTRVRGLSRVLAGIKAAQDAGLSAVKINMVVLRGINDDEILDLVDFAFDHGLTLRFIEFMRVTPLWRSDFFMPIEEVQRICARRYRLQRVAEPGFGPSQYYRAPDGLLGFIHTAEHNCRRCRRLRLTARGEFKICLYEEDGVDLADLLRRQVSDDLIADILRVRMAQKQRVSFQDWPQGAVYMSRVGG